MATRCKVQTHLKRPWCWERLKAKGEGDNRGWDGWMASPTQWTWVWVNSGSWWWTGRPGVLQSMGLQRVGQDWEAEISDYTMQFISNLSCRWSDTKYWSTAWRFGTPRLNCSQYHKECLIVSLSIKIYFKKYSWAYMCFHILLEHIS